MPPMGQEGIVSTTIPGWRLRAGKPRILVAQVRPPLNEFTAEEGRMRLSQESEEYVASLYAALSLMRSREGTFCVFPEYSWPADEAERLTCRAAEELPDGAMLIAPFEHLSLSEYEGVLRGTGVDVAVIRDELHDAEGSVEFRERAIVNACVVFVKVGDSLIAFPQRKLRPAQLEEEGSSGRWTFVNGRYVRIFRGEGVAIAVLICFDFIARDPTDDFEALGALENEALTYIFVPECNPRPLHTTYVGSLSKLFGVVRPPDAVVFANVADDTPLPLENAQLGFSAVVGPLGDASFETERVVEIDGFVQNATARSIHQLRGTKASLPHPEIRTLIIRTEPTVAVFDLPRPGTGASKNVREARSSTSVLLFRFLGAELGWQRIYRLAPFPQPAVQVGIPAGYVEHDWDLVGVAEAHEELIRLIKTTNQLPVWVTGEGGMGKTALVAHALAGLGDAYSTVWIDLGDLEHTDEALRERLLIAFGVPLGLVQNTEEQIALLQQRMAERPTVLVLDSYDRWPVAQYPGWLDELLSGWMPRIVITSRERPQDRSGDLATKRLADPQLGVRKLSVDEAHALIVGVAKQTVARERVEIVTRVTDRSALACVWLGELIRHAPGEAESLIQRLETATPGIQAVYDAMLDGVSPEARVLVGAVCQLPAPIEESDLQRVVGCKPGKLHAAIRELEQRSLIMKREAGWQPRHPFVKQYWREPAGSADKIVARAAERSQIWKRLLAWATDLLARNGGELNWKGYDVLESRWTNLGYLLRQLKDSTTREDRELFLQLWSSADTFLWTKARWRERLALGRAAERLSREIDDKRARGKALYEGIAEMLWHLYGPSDEIFNHLDEAAGLFDEIGDLVHRARVEWYRSRMLADQRKLDLALTAAQSAVRIAEQSGDTRTIGLAHHGVGNIFRRSRRGSLALEEFQTGLHYFTAADDKEMIAVAKRRLGCVRMDEGDLGQALLDLESATDQLRALRLPGEAAETAILHAQALAKLGEWRDAVLERDIAAALLEPLGSSIRNEEIAATTRLIDEARTRRPN